MKLNYIPVLLMKNMSAVLKSLICANAVKCIAAPPVIVTSLLMNERLPLTNRRQPMT